MSNGHPYKHSLDDDDKIIDLGEQRRLRARRHLIEGLRSAFALQMVCLFAVVAAATASFVTCMSLGLQLRASAALTLVAAGASFLLVSHWLSKAERDEP